MESELFVQSHPVSSVPQGNLVFGSLLKTDADALLEQDIEQDGLYKSITEKLEILILRINLIPVSLFFHKAKLNVLLKLHTEF